MIQLTNNRIIFSIITIILIFVIFILQSSMVENKMLTGYWKASSSFCEDAELSTFLLHIDKVTTLSSLNVTSYKGYLLIVDIDGKIIINDYVDIFLRKKLYKGKSAPKSPGKTYNAKFKFGDKSLSYDDFFPSKQNILYDPYNQKIILYKDDNIYSILYKDSSLGQ